MGRICGWFDSPLRALMFQKAGNGRNETKDRMNVMDRKGGKKMRAGERAGEGGERDGIDDDGEGIGGHLRKQTRQKTKRQKWREED